jgi:hypothetical protein
MSSLLPTFCGQTRTRHADRSFCVYCGSGEEYQHLFLAQSSQASFPSQAPLPELAPVLGAQSAPIEVSDSPLAVRLNPLTPSNKRVAEASRDFTNKRQSSAENLKRGFNASAPAMSARAGQRPGQVIATEYKFLVSIISQPWQYDSPENERRGIINASASQRFRYRKFNFLYVRN